MRRDEWRGEDMAFHMRSMTIDAKQISLAEKNIDIGSINLNEPFFSIYNYTGKRPKRPPVVKPDAVLEEDSTLQWNPDLWRFAINKLRVENGILKTSIQTNREPIITLTAPTCYFPNSIARLSISFCVATPFRQMSGSLYMKEAGLTSNRSPPGSRCIHGGWNFRS
jgi:hypothetical protein